jgi:hypothetical protein
MFTGGTDDYIAGTYTFGFKDGSWRYSDKLLTLLPEGLTSPVVNGCFQDDTYEYAVYSVGDLWGSTYWYDNPRLYCSASTNFLGMSGRIPCGSAIALFTMNGLWYKHTETWSREYVASHRTSYFYDEVGVTQYMMAIPRQDGRGINFHPLPIDDSTDLGRAGIVRRDLATYETPPETYQGAYSFNDIPWPTSVKTYNTSPANYEVRYPLQRNQVDASDKTWFITQTGKVWVYQMGVWNQFTGSNLNKLVLSAGLLQLEDGSLLGIERFTSDDGRTLGRLGVVTLNALTQQVSFKPYKAGMPELLLGEPDRKSTAGGYDVYANWRDLAVQFALDDLGNPVFTVTQFKDKRKVANNTWYTTEYRTVMYRKVRGKWEFITLAAGTFSGDLGSVNCLTANGLYP